MKKLKVTVDGKAYEVEIELLDSAPETASSPQPAAAAPAASPGKGEHAVLSPLAGKVVELKAQPGQSVSEGQTLLVLEAMKMNTLVSASDSGTIGVVNVAPGDLVEEGQALLTIV